MEEFSPRVNQSRRRRFGIRKGAKTGALVGLIGGTVFVGGAIVVALLEIPILGRHLVLDGTEFSNAVGASISIATIAIGGAIIGAVVGAFARTNRER